MATGFRPKYERTIELAGYSSEELMLLAIEASKSLGWQAGSIKRDKSDFYTPTSFRSWQEKVILSAIDGKDGQLLATSICTSMQLMDWGKNKQNLNKLTATMQQLQNVHNISPTEADTANKTTCAYTPEEKNTVIAHIRHFYGGIKGITKNIVSPSGVEILIVEPTSRFDCYTLVTCGAGASVMPVPDKATPSRCEFCMCMPPTWNTEDSWPIDWLLQCVSWLQQGNSWLACGHSLSDGTPLQDDTLMTSMLLTIPEERDKGAENCQLPNGDSVAIYQLVPVYTEEVLFKQANGIIPLLDKMKNVSYIVDTHRENTCRNFSAFEENGDSSISMDEKANASLRSILTIRKGNMATPLLVYINIALFVIMSICGVSLLAPTGISIIKWGADFGPLTLTGDWWRTITCNFIHIGVIHVLMNMYALLYIGIFLEQLIGGRRLISAYFLTGLFSALASLAMHPETISAGASGSIFGLYGIFLSYLVFHHRIEKGQRKSLLYSIGFFVFYNLMSGARAEGIDNAAHIGGLLSGFVLGIIYVVGYKFEKPDAQRTVSIIGELGIFCIFLFSFMILCKNVPPLYPEIRNEWESGIVEAYLNGELEEENENSNHSAVNATDNLSSRKVPAYTPVGNDDTWLSYYDAATKFSCQYPTNWIKIAGAKGIIDGAEPPLLMLVNGGNQLTITALTYDTQKEFEHMKELSLTLPRNAQGEPSEDYQLSNVNINGLPMTKITNPLHIGAPDEPGEDVKQIALHYFQESKKRSFAIVMLVYDEEAETDLNAITSSIQITQ